ncbi:uncharacterized protein LOC133841668 [Drosophila sulfurigaster albostrigata]|uniref:uncharacterized protein LOC133841668 n=1 Tax=Drosophila sulfurigaster albostrigata TaxID=89887 RepID=UPI002D218C1D|nr:uncharacterized protein LOC133841668 [Drosophila sulfurigaster albostrigata]
MHHNVVNALLLAIVIWHICEAELRLCVTTKDDRIIFPDDNRNTWNSINTSSTTEIPLNSTTATLDDLHRNATQDLNRTTTTTELPDIGNRILVETLPVCEPGFQLRAGRCRKSA